MKSFGGEFFFFFCSCSDESLFNVVETQNLFFRWGVANGEIQNKEVLAWKYLTSADFDYLFRAILVTGSAFHMKTCSFSREFTKCHHSFVQFCFRIHCDDDGWVLKVGDKTLREGFTGFHWCSLTKSKNLMSSFDLSSS